MTFEIPNGSKSSAKREDFFDSEMGDADQNGSNPDVFHYSISEKSEQGIILIRLVFYGTLKH